MSLELGGPDFVGGGRERQSASVVRHLGEGSIAARAGTPFFSMQLSRIAPLDQRTALPDQCLHSAEADVQPPKEEVRV